jgi:hypothetical protein
VWSYSFAWPGVDDLTAGFEGALNRLLDGHSVGSALQYLKARQRADVSGTVATWAAASDVCGLMILGDPAVRLAVQEVDTPFVREAEMSFTAPAAAPDEVLFSAIHPRAVPPEAWRRLLVYAHVEQAAELIRTDAAQLLGREHRDYRSSGANSTAALQVGTEITLVPQGDGLEFEPVQKSITWSGAWQRAEFLMRGTPARAGHVSEGSIACYVGPLLVAEIRLPVVVLESGAPAPAAATDTVASAKMYQAVFASYSHADAAVVEAVETACRSLGMDYLRDVMKLRSGQNWSDQILRMIEEADVFQLFWSPSSAESPYVEQEWRHALNLMSRKGASFIRPVYWQKPLPVIPPELSRIHFAPVDFSRHTRRPAEPTATPSLGEDLRTITVSTYAAKDVERQEGTRLLARTRISIAGDADSWLADDEVGDEKYLEAHYHIVREAVAARLAYIESLARRGDSAAMPREE